MKKPVRKLFGVLGLLTATLFSNSPLWADHSYSKKTGKSYGTKAYSGKDCFRYEMITHRGYGAFRFLHDRDNYTQLRKGSKYGKICRGGKVTLELSKKHPGTHVSLHINGQSYHFTPHEPAHRYINTWHRKYVTIHLPYAKQGYGQRDRRHGRGDHYANSNAHYDHNYGYKSKKHSSYKKYRKHHAHQHHRAHQHHGYRNNFGFKHHHRHYNW